MKLTYAIQPNDQFYNLKEVLKAKFAISDRLLLKLRKAGKIFINGSPSEINLQVQPKDTIDVFLDFDEDNSNIVPVKMDLNIIYEDDCLLVINKPAGMPVHPSMLHYEDSLSNGIKYYFDLIGLHKKIRPVNRLDKDTSGIVIFAKNEYVQECLSRQMNEKIFVKEYIAICEGVFKEKSGTINAPISRKEDSIIERCVKSDGSPSITHYEVLEEYSDYSVVQLILETGRTHQIRVHLSYIGHPIIGDTLYGTISSTSTSSLIGRQALHSYKVSFVHPISMIPVTLFAPLYEDMAHLINNFKNNK